LIPQDEIATIQYSPGDTDKAHKRRPTLVRVDEESTEHARCKEEVGDALISAEVARIDPSRRNSHHTGQSTCIEHESEAQDLCNIPALTIILRSMLNITATNAAMITRTLVLSLTPRVLVIMAALVAVMLSMDRRIIVRAGMLHRRVLFPRLPSLLLRHFENSTTNKTRQNLG
jgi:hypothetical protein